MMYRELIGSDEINISHELSGFVSIRRYDGLRRIDEDRNLSSKIEMNFNNRRGLQK